STLKSKSPSIDYYQNKVFIVFQEINESKFNIKTYTFENGDPTVALVDVASNRPYSDLFDAMPVVAYTNGNLLVVWKDDFQGNIKLVHRLGTSNGTFYSGYSTFPDTDLNSSNPSLCAKKTLGDVVFHLAYQQSDNKIYYKKLSVANNEIIAANNIDITNQSPYTKNYKPSLIVLVVNGNESIRFSWIGESFSAAEEEMEETDAPLTTEKRVVFRAFSGTTLSSFWNFGSAVNYANINSTDDINYIVGWSQNSGLQNQYV